MTFSAATLANLQLCCAQAAGNNGGGASRASELGLVQLGVIRNANNENIARVVLRRDVDETTGIASERIIAYYTNGTTVDPYTGPWEIEDPNCGAETPQGVVNNWGADL